MNATITSSGIWVCGESKSKLNAIFSFKLPETPVVVLKKEDQWAQLLLFGLVVCGE